MRTKLFWHRVDSGPYNGSYVLDMSLGVHDGLQIKAFAFIELRLRFHVRHCRISLDQTGGSTPA